MDAMSVNHGPGGGVGADEATPEIDWVGGAPFIYNG